MKVRVLSYEPTDWTVSVRADDRPSMRICRCSADTTIYLLLFRICRKIYIFPIVCLYPLGFKDEVEIGERWYGVSSFHEICRSNPCIASKSATSLPSISSRPGIALLTSKAQIESFPKHKLIAWKKWIIFELSLPHQCSYQRCAYDRIERRPLHKDQCERCPTSSWLL